MPYVQVSEGENGIQIFYRIYGRGPIKVLMLIGLGAPHEAWMAQIKALTGTDVGNDEKKARMDDDDEDEDVSNNNGIEICALDNRGSSRSTIPTQKADFELTLMAKDGIAVMDHLGWKKAHIFGHSMGSMIGLKLAAFEPDRVLSLALINTADGGYDMFPKACLLTVSVLVRIFLAKSREERTGADLDYHFSQGYLDERVGQRTRRSILYQQYVTNIAENGVQPDDAFLGQFGACWRHRMTQKEYEQIRSGRFLVSVIHGTQDIAAPLSLAKRKAEKLYPFAKFVHFQGGHLVFHERVNEVNQELLKLIRASELNISPHDWTNLPPTTTTDSISSAIVEQLKEVFIYFLTVLVIALQNVGRLMGKFKPVRVASSATSK